MSYQETIEQLVRDNNARVVYHHDWRLEDANAQARTLDRELHLAPWRDDFTETQRENWFWVALHELGHIVHQHTNEDSVFEMLMGLPPTMNSIEREAEAWQWGIEHAGRELTDVARASIKHGLGSYLYGQPKITRGPALTSLAQIAGTDVPVDLIAEIDPDPWHQHVSVRGWAALESPELANAA
jgi:hypothetical protein